MLRVDHRRDAARLLRLRDRVERERRLTAGLGSVDLDNPSAGIAADAERMVQRHRAARDHLNVPVGLLAQLHDRALAIILLDLVDRRLKGFQFRRIHLSGLVRLFFRHS